MSGKGPDGKSLQLGLKDSFQIDAAFACHPGIIRHCYFFPHISSEPVIQPLYCLGRGLIFPRQELRYSCFLFGGQEVLQGLTNQHSIVLLVLIMIFLLAFQTTPGPIAGLKSRSQDSKILSKDVSRRGERESGWEKWKWHCA